MIKTFFVAVLTLILCLGLYLYFYLGGYKEVEIAQAKRGPFNFLYKAHTGAYHEIGPTISSVEDWARAQGIACPQTFGEYLDDPDTMDQDRLRSRGGCVLASPLGQKTGDLTFEDRPERQYVVAQFSGSPAIGPFKVYPKVKKYFVDQHLKMEGPSLEIYTIQGNSMTTEYLFPIAN